MNHHTDGDRYYLLLVAGGQSAVGGPAPAALGRPRQHAGGPGGQPPLARGAGAAPLTRRAGLGRPRARHRDHGLQARDLPDLAAAGPAVEHVDQPGLLHQAPLHQRPLCE